MTARPPARVNAHTALIHPCGPVSGSKYLAGAAVGRHPATALINAAEQTIEHLTVFAR